MKHGTRAGYQYHSCRCEPCRKAATAYMRKMRQQQRDRLREGEVVGLAHGTRSTYENWGCRCDDCRAAKSLVNKLG